MPRNKFRIERIQLGSGRFDLLRRTRTQIRATLDIDIDESTQAAGRRRWSQRARGRSRSTSPLTGHIKGTSEAIKVLPLLVPEIDRAAGRLDGNVMLGGTLGAADVQRRLPGARRRLELYRTNLKISDAAGRRHVRRRRAHVRRRSGATAQGQADGRRQLHLAGRRHDRHHAARGDQLLVADTPEFRVLASPDIVLHAGANGYEVEGEVKIPKARISPREITTTVNTSPDERIVGLPDVEDTEPSTADRVTSRVKVVLGDAVRVDTYGLKARLDGSVTVSTVPDDVPRGNGVIRVVEGQYKAFGQDVRITRGTLTLQRLAAQRAGARHRGRAQDQGRRHHGGGQRARDDRRNLSSRSPRTPSMSSNEALSYLLTGRSIDTLQSGEAANVNQAAESLAVSGGGLLLGGLGTRLGLDEVSVERTGDDDTSVVLGKALSPKLFVSYGISIAEAINTIKLRYTLNERWSLKAEAGIEQSADIEYRIER